MPFLEANHIRKRYAAHTALDDVSISVRKGRVFGLLGPNGAGKTSLIRIINRITAPDEGKVIFDGRPMQAEDVRRIGYLPEERGLYPKMKVGEQAIYLAQLKGVNKHEARKRLTDWFEKFDIMPWWNKKVEELSKGMQQKVQFVCTVIHEPELLIFDEPFSGFDPVNADLLKREILELAGKERTVIFSTHNMQSVEEVCDDFALINKSRVVLHGAVREVRRENSLGIIRMVVEGELPADYLGRIRILEKTELPGSMTKLRVRKETTAHNRDLVRDLPESVRLVSFYEEIPSMHDIFIKTVGHGIEEENPIQAQQENTDTHRRYEQH
ncbi:ABC transporter, ATP-binding protein [Porphyromonas gingivalis TDC60]|uniref:ABC transporter ATP-binding protein n=1 Tax=Porphyromonas gingivalis TaxID=837 RepID=UPI00020F032F|nr:ABC transporter ATP-binding protein [Porphyromonas gingivalis]AUR48032.1 ABC transporter ATP-binding protein [Porphyromonas gingivalis]BAK25028.1 ABC transporter, ATP-binding protein [Porphyromonas gingivalis TDC60]